MGVQLCVGPDEAHVGYKVVGRLVPGDAACQLRWHIGYCGAVEAGSGRSPRDGSGGHRSHSWLGAAEWPFVLFIFFIAFDQMGRYIDG